MEGRKSLGLACCLLFCTGCITTSNSQKVSHSAPVSQAAQHVAPPADTSAKKDPKTGARVLIATAKFNEAEARTKDASPEEQFKIRYMAKETYQQAIKIDPNSVEAHRGLGRVYVDLGDYERAQETFTKAQAKFPKESVFWYELGQMHNRKKDFAQASQCLKNALDLEPENRQYLTILGLTLARAGQTDQSVALLSRSMGLAAAHYNVARMLLHLQRTEEGVQHLRQAVQSNPNLESARQLLSDVENGGRVNVQIDFQAGS